MIWYIAVDNIYGHSLSQPLPLDESEFDRIGKLDIL